MTLFEQLQTDRKTAFKAREKEKKEILNYVIAQIKQKQIDQRVELSDDDIIKIIKKEIKTRKESIGFMLGVVGQEETLEIEQKKVACLEIYLPIMLSQEQLKAIVQETIDAMGIDDPKQQRGQVIGHVMKAYGATVDGSLLNTLITSR